MWFQTIPIGLNLNGSYAWRDLSGDSTRLLTTNGTEYVIARSTANAINFHPSLYFTGNAAKQARARFANLAQSTIIGLIAPSVSGFNKDQSVLGLSGRSNTERIIGKDKITSATGTLDYGSEAGQDLLYQSSDALSETQSKEQIAKIVSYLKTDAPCHSVWGEAQTSILSIGALSGNNAFDGYIPEIIAYGRLLTPGERRRVESYLAVKYGITLSDSYLDSEGNLIWDMSESTAYNNRVTAIGRDITGSLMQPKSASTYEQSPNFSTDPSNDTYYKKDSYSLPSSSRLLVISRETGNGMPDKGYTFWGDDNGALSTYVSEQDSLWHIMNRTWLVKTNMAVQPDTTTNRWTGNGLNIIRNNFTDAIRQENASENATAVSLALAADGGAISFTCPSSHPSFEVGFASNGEAVCVFGFLVSANGSVYTIVNGVTSNTAVATNVSGSNITVRKENGVVYLQVNGTGDSAMSFALPKDKANASLNAIIRTTSSDNILALTDVRLGGAVDTGDQVELSYDLTNNSEFKDYSRKRSVILIDPTGERNFTLDDSNMVYCSNPDNERGKTIFHNVFWDKDGSGSDVFTFAYFDGIAVDAEPTPATCNGTSSNNDGSIDINVKIGTPVYTYTLVADSVQGKTKGTTIATGTFYGDDHKITGLTPGAYKLCVSQGGGNDLTGTGNSLYSSYSHSASTFTGGEISWTVADVTSHYRLGAESYLKEDVTQYGFDVRGNRAYIIYKGYTSMTQYVDIKEGDVLSVTLSGFSVIYKLNGKQILRDTVWSFRLWRLCAKYGAGESHITGLTVNGNPITKWDTYGNVQVETPKSNTTVLNVNVGSECDATLPNGSSKSNEAIMLAKSNNTAKTADYTENESLSVTATGIALTSTAELAQKEETAATLMVFDASGKLVSEQQMFGGITKIADFVVPAPGVYIVKAITGNGEYTRKISIK